MSYIKILKIILLTILILLTGMIIFQAITETNIIDLITNKKQKTISENAFEKEEEQSKFKTNFLQEKLQKLNFKFWKSAVFLTYLKKEKTYLLKPKYQKETLIKLICENISKEIHDQNLNFKIKFFGENIFEIIVSLQDHPHIQGKRKFHLTMV